MNTALLQKWLDLPDGLWPPEPHVLLGVPRGADPARIQAAALARMEKLRPHQLMNPELVTEGMNRLAQALIVLEKPAVVDSLFDPPPLRPPEESSFNLALPMSAAAAPVILDAEVVTAEVVKETPKRKRRRRRRSAAEPPVQVPELAVAVEVSQFPLEKFLRSHLVHSRRAIAAWEKLGPVLGVPSWTPVTSADVLLYLEAMVEAGRAVPSISLRNPVVPTRPERLAMMVERSLPIATFRMLQKSQREQVASDWAHGLALLRQNHAALRAELRSRKPRPTLKRRLTAARRWLRRHPEWRVVLLLTVAAAVAAHRFLKSSAH